MFLPRLRHASCTKSASDEATRRTIKTSSYSSSVCSSIGRPFFEQCLSFFGVRERSNLFRTFISRRFLAGSHSQPHLTAAKLLDDATASRTLMLAGHPVGDIHAPFVVASEVRVTPREVECTNNSHTSRGRGHGLAFAGVYCAHTQPSTLAAALVMSKDLSGMHASVHSPLPEAPEAETLVSSL